MSLEGRLFVLGLIIVIDTAIILKHEWDKYERR